MVFQLEKSGEIIMQPLISIVIPTYNHAAFLKKAIESILSQTYVNWEAIIINNFSTDNTHDIVESFGDSRLKLYDFRNNGIIGASRNWGIKHASGEYVAFLDSDDLWYPKKLELCFKEFSNGADIVCHGEVWLKNDEIVRKELYGPVNATNYHSLLFKKNCLSTSAIMVRKRCLEAVAGFSVDPDFATVEDYELWLKLSKAGFRFAFVENYLGQFTIHGGNSSKSVLRQMRAELAVLHKHFCGWGEYTVLDRLRRVKRIIRVYVAYGSRWAKLRNTI